MDSLFPYSHPTSADPVALEAQQNQHVLLEHFNFD